MGFVDSVFGGQEQIKFETNPQSKDAKFAREQIRKKAEEGFGDVPLRGIAELPGQTEERQLARTTATDLAKPREKFDFKSSPEVQGIIQKTVEQGNLLVNRIGRSLQKSGGFQTTTGRDVLGRTVKQVEGNIAASLAPFAEAERGRDFADVNRRQNLVSVLERLGLTEEERERGTEQAKLDSLFAQKTGTLGQEQQMLNLLQNIIQLQPSSEGFVQGAKPGVLEQVSGIAEVAGPLIAAFSDEDLKENIESIDSAIELVSQLDGKTYNFIDGPKSGGIIAQDLEKIMPDMVSEKDGHKVVDYTAVIGLLVNAVKELANKVA